jgi:hypothetical protein
MRQGTCYSNPQNPHFPNLVETCMHAAHGGSPGPSAAGQASPPNH